MLPKPAPCMNNDLTKDKLVFSIKPRVMLLFITSCCYVHRSHIGSTTFLPSGGDMRPFLRWIA